MVSSIGSTASSLFQYYSSIQNSADSVSTAQGQSFEELLSNGKVSNQNDNQNFSITALPDVGSSQSSSSSSSSSSNIEMDLNGDGVVTLDEILQYTAMQMSEQVNEQIAADEGSEQMQNESGQNLQQDSFDLNSFKTQMASKAYQMGENLLSASIGPVTGSFAV